MEKLFTDIRFALRTLGKNPAFAIVAILVLALGIGATSAIFSVVNAVLIRPLPYKDPARLVAISSTYQRNGATRSFATVSLNEVEAWRRESRSLDALGSFVFSAVPVTVGTDSMFLVTAAADPELLETLGVLPQMGRNLPGSGSSQKSNTTLISHKLWVSAFHSDPDAVGRSLTVDGDLFTVVGVLPADFQFPRADASYADDQPDLLYPVANIADMWGRNSTQWFAIGRLKPTVALAQADSELKAITSRFAAQNPAGGGLGVQLAPLNSETTAKVRPALILMLGISIVLLLIACTNIMNLLFSRAAARGREMAIRKAVGASRGRLVRQMLTESACLTFLAGILGVVLARIVLDSLVSLSPAHLPVSGRVGIDWTVLAFTFAVCSLAALFAGGLPALHRSRGGDDLVSVAGNRASGSRALARFQRVLMVAQMALGVGLLAAAGVLAHSLLKLSSVNPGFHTQGTIGFELAFPSGRPELASRLSRQILDATRAIPGVASAGWITHPPPETRAGIFMPFYVTSGEPSKLQAFANYQITSEDYFATAGIPLDRGRDFTLGDAKGAPQVAIVNETLARQYFPRSDALGQKVVTPWDGKNNPREIVGIIRDIHDRGLGEKSIPTLYIPYQQFALAYGGVVVRVETAPESVIPEIRRRISRVDPSIAVKNFSTIAARVYKTLDEPRFYTVMSVACALMAVLFVTLGLYGVVSYSVARRTSEIGIRMALGAPREAILRGILWQGLGMAAAGIAIGVGLSLAATRLLRSLLFEVKPIDPATLAAAAGLVLAVTLCASAIPARRASRVDPMIALRYE